MKAEKIMTTSIVTVDMDDSLSIVKEIFDNANFHHLLVVESDILFGIISDRDLLKVLSPNIGTIRETPSDLAILNKKAHQIMTRKPISISPYADINEIIRLYDKHHISCLPVVDSRQRPLGIISWRDVLKAIKSELERTKHNEHPKTK